MTEISRATVVARAQCLRRNMTRSEARLWTALRRRAADGFRFRRQHPLGPYILDFYCPAVRVAVEVDGDAHLAAAQQAHDERRDLFLQRAGVLVLRVPAREVGDRLDRVVEWIIARCRSRVGE